MTGSSSRGRSNKPSNMKKDVVDLSRSIQDISSDDQQIVDVSSVPIETTSESSLKASKSTNLQANSSNPRTNTLKSVGSLGKNQNNDKGSDGFSSGFEKGYLSQYSSAIKGIALGMIETRGMVPAIEAADAMTKAAEVSLISREFVGGGYVTVMIYGPIPHSQRMKGAHGFFHTQYAWR